MPNVFIEPMPKGASPTAPTDYQIEFEDGRKAAGPFKTQQEAVNEAKRLGYKPLIARVRETSKGNPDHWRSAD